MPQFKVTIQQGQNNQNFVLLDKQLFNLFISPLIPLIQTTQPPVEPFIFNAGSYKTVTMNRLPAITLLSGQIITHPYDYLNMITLKFEDIQCHSKSYQYYVRFEKV
jgi:hypothetical protein